MDTIDEDELSEKMETERLKMEALETERRAVQLRLKKVIQEDPQRADDLARQLSMVDERLEHQRRLYEDLEFQQLEDQSKFDEEKESLTQRLVDAQDSLVGQYRTHESRLQELDQEQRTMVRDARERLEDLEGQRGDLVADCRKEKLRLAIADGRIAELSHQLTDMRLANGGLLAEAAIPDLSPDLRSPTPESNKSEYDNDPESADGVPQKAPTTGPPTLDKAEHDAAPSRSSRAQGFPGRLPRATNGSDTKSRPSNGSVVIQPVKQPIPASPPTASAAQRGTPTSPATSPKADRNNVGIGQQNGKSTWEMESEHSSDVSQPGSTSGSGLAQAPRVRSTVQRRRNKEARPLTKYLPVTDPEFNLHSHIEASGHQLEQWSAQVTLDEAACSGFLLKLGARFPSWRKRWFVFDRRRRVLAYYANRTSTKIRGCFSFADIMDVFVDHLHRVKSPNPRFTFCVETPRRTFYLVAPCAEVMRIWIDVIFTGAEGYLALNPPASTYQLDLVGLPDQ